jgi:hypothetical protein
MAFQVDAQVASTVLEVAADLLKVEAGAFGYLRVAHPLQVEQADALALSFLQSIDGPFKLL